ncbi:PD-(D/E)XK nuclease-like domain-containing protein [Salinispirillum sp. LH 10-3-1]|uniref:PD-(D/E)XK nuclease-like domain-containing protein n=1 Tax=Salinispirillum sp. LH 10-3-1 TaxID=2952525 RepID=A0AB38YC17_9GAMM
MTAQPINPFFAVPAAEEPIQKVDKPVLTPGFWKGVSNEAYHAAAGISKSGLDHVAHSPSTFEWARTAPVDEDKTVAFDMGTALHTLLLEPELFEKQFIIAPDFNRRTNQGKADEAAFLAEVESQGKIIMSAEEGRKLPIMRESVMAHPVARWIFERDGINESTIVWKDSITGELCRCRPDRILTGNHPVIVDVKKVDGLERFEKHVEEFRYHVQDAMYTDGYEQHFGARPTFLFLAVSSTVSAGRYAVDVVELPDDWKAAGYDLYRRDLHTYHACREADDWMHIRTLQRPRWAN